MKKNLLILVLVFPSLSFNPSIPSKQRICCVQEEIGRCSRDAYCTACKNCSGCSWCTAGGTCGVCDAEKKSYKSSPKKSSTTSAYSQCQAITKKGTQCSRKARSGGYCYQHGG